MPPIPWQTEFIRKGLLIFLGVGIPEVGGGQDLILKTENSFLNESSPTHCFSFKIHSLVGSFILNIFFEVNDLAMQWSQTFPLGLFFLPKQFSLKNCKFLGFSVSLTAH